MPFGNAIFFPFKSETDFIVEPFLTIIPAFMWLSAIAYKELYMYFDKKISKEDAVNLIKQRSRNYAKRQYTFFNHQLDVKWFNCDVNNFDNTIKEVVNYIENN